MSGFCLRRGTRPVLVSVPHDGSALPRDVAARMSPAGLAQGDRDREVTGLYDGEALADCSLLVAGWSRYLVDLNRDPAGGRLYPGRRETTLCPSESFSGAALYRPGLEPGETEIAARRERYWRPYHAALDGELARLIEGHGAALLWEGHSIRSRVPRLFEGALPDFSFGTDGGRTCPAAVTDELLALTRGAGYSAVVNGRFRGGYTTRHYGDPPAGRIAIQLELSQATYLDEDTGRLRRADAARVSTLIGRLVEAAARLL